MSAIAVSPIAMPVRSRRTNALGNICRIAEPGCCSRTVKLHADTMNSPRQAASIRYSGQCFVAAEIARANQVRYAVRFSASIAARCVIPFFAAVCIRTSDSRPGLLVTNDQRNLCRTRAQCACHFSASPESYDAGELAVRDVRNIPDWGSCGD